MPTKYLYNDLCGTNLYFQSTLPLSVHRPLPPRSSHRKGTERTFPSPVPGFRPISCSDRVQIATFPLLYPVSVRFPAQIGYRRPLFRFCTRFPSDFPIRSGTDHHFLSPVPGLCHFPCSVRVQIALFSPLYPPPKSGALFDVSEKHIFITPAAQHRTERG